MPTLEEYLNTLKSYKNIEKLNVVKVDIIDAYDKYGGFDFQKLIRDGLLRIERNAKTNKTIPLTLKEVPS